MSEIVFRWSGILLILGAALLGIAILMISLKPVINQPLPPAGSILLLLSAILLLLALPAMYARQANAAGWLGFTGHALLQTGVLLLIVVAAPTLIYPSLKLTPGENPLLFLLGIALTAGLLLTGIATVRAGIFPRGAGILLLVAMAGFFFDFFIAEFLPPLVGQVGSGLFGVLLALSLGWIGAALWIGKLAPTIANVVPAH
ncbi:MAG: hypothetical protein HY835_02900 [Anaerolineae bacterium]|nr:hypothetical protein [Anaerolineae bacterium]